MVTLFSSISLLFSLTVDEQRCFRGLRFFSDIPKYELKFNLSMINEDKLTPGRIISLNNDDSWKFRITEQNNLFVFNGFAPTSGSAPAAGFAPADFAPAVSSEGEKMKGYVAFRTVGTNKTTKHGMIQGLRPVCPTQITFIITSIK